MVAAWATWNVFLSLGDQRARVKYGLLSSSKPQVKHPPTGLSTATGKGQDCFGLLAHPT